jgi:sec-independent protein translocase protein TatC
MGLTMDPNAQMESVVAPATSPTRRRFRPALPHLPFRRRKPDVEPGTMSLTGHLVELRNRLFISAISLVPGTILGFVFSGEIIHILKAPLPTDRPLMALGLTEPFMIDLQVAVVCGVIVGMPVILYQLWRFISPGLTPRERAAARPWVPMALLFFCIGVGLAYLILPVASRFLYGFESKDVQLMLTAEAYFSFVSTLFLTFGLVMEYPVILVLLSKVGIVSSQRLRRSRRTALLICTVVAALVTPGGDVVSPLALAATMYGLFEVSIIMIRLGGH